MEAVLVTGGCGFVGSHVVDDLVRRGANVRVLDLLHPLSHAGERPGYLNPQAEYVFGDVREGDVVARCLEGVSAVSHQAAMVGLGSDFGDVADYVSHNDLGTATLLRELARRPKPPRLVLASSMVVYGEGRYRCPEHGLVRPGPRTPQRLDAREFEPPCPACGRALLPEPIPEDAPLDPRNVYAATKTQQEHLCVAYARETGAAVTALRYHNVYGPRMPRDTPYAGVASIFRSALEAGRAPRVFEDGRQLRDFVHVRDVAAANVVALDASPHYVNIVLNGHHGFQGALPYTPKILQMLVESLPPNCVFNVSAIGTAQLPATTHALILGGHVRVGLEDNLYYAKGELATNEQLVERTVRIIRELGHEPATPSEAREMLGLSPVKAPVSAGEAGGE